MSLLDLTGKTWRRLVNDGGIARTHTEVNDGRQGRLETCIINAAIMARSHGNGPKRYNKPIVVDIDLPIISSSIDDRQAVEDFNRHLQPVVRFVPSYTTYSSTMSSSSQATSDDESETSASAESIHNTFYSR